MGDIPTQVTQLLQAAARGDSSASDALLPLVYDELRRIAGVLMRRERSDHTLQPTALVHEAYVRLVGPNEVEWQNKAHFFNAAARSMRRILIDHARHVRASRETDRRMTDASFLQTPASFVSGIDAAEDLLALDTALDTLRTRDERQYDVVMLRYFAGLTIDQTAGVLALSPATIKNEWMYARAWLLREMATNKERE